MNARRKILNSATGVALSIAVVLSAIFTLFPVQAWGETTYPDFSPFVTSDTLAVKDSHGATQTYRLDKDSANVTLPTVSIADGTTVSLTMDFALSDTDQVAGKTYAIQLPAALSAQSTSPKSFNNGLGTWFIDGGGKFVVHFSDDADDYDGRAGSFAITTTFSAKGLGSDSGGEIPFKIGSSTVNLPVQVLAPEVDPSVSKRGTYHSDGTITWTVTVNSGNDGKNGGLKNVTVTDDFSGNQTLQPTPAPTWGTDTVKDSGVTPHAAPWYESTGATTAVFHLGDMAHNQTKDLVYTTKALNPDEKPVFPNTAVQYKNTATLGADEITSNNPSASASVNNAGTINSWIAKNAGTAATDAAGRITSIPWSVTVNPGGKGTVPAGSTVTDVLPKYLTLNGGVSLGGTPLSENDSSKDVYYTVTDAGGIQTITVHFTKELTTEQNLSFTTAVDSAYYNTNNDSFSNTATLTQGSGSANGGKSGVGPGSSVLAKKGISYDAAAHLATWTITVNSNRIAMTKPIVTDTIDWNHSAGTGDYQKFHSISAAGVPLTEASSETAMTATPATYYVSGKTVKVHLPDFADKAAPVVITLVTEVTDPAYFGGNGSNTVYNSASLATDNPNISGSQDASQTVNSQVIDKTGGYNYSTKTLTWDIDVNQNKMTMTDAVVTDTLPAGPTLTGVKIKGGADIPEGSGSPYYYTLSGPTLTVHLGSLSDKTTIEVTESVPDSMLAQNNADFSVTNKASIHYHELGAVSDPSATYTQPIDQSVVEKTGALINGQNRLDWSVKINKNEVPSATLGIQSGTEVTLSDTLQDGLELDPDSVRLYHFAWDTSNNGSWTKGTEISLTPSQAVKYDPSTRLFTFTFPAGTDFSKAYELDFSTDITKGGTYSNTISMNGITGNQSGQSSGYSISDQTVSAVFSGLQRGKATITKVDQDTNQPIPGTAFTLYQGETPIQTLKTDAQGHAVFSNLKQGKTYTVRETAPAPGYQNNSTPWTFTVDASNLQAAQTFRDLSETSVSSQPVAPPTKGAFSFIKVIGNGTTPLPNAGFTLYDSQNNPVQTAVSGADGLVQFQNVPLGTYTVRETSVPANFSAADSFTVTLAYSDPGKTTIAATGVPSLVRDYPTYNGGGNSSGHGGSNGGGNSGGNGGTSSPETPSSSNVPAGAVSSSGSSSSSASALPGSKPSVSSTTPGGVGGWSASAAGAIYIKKTDPEGKALSGAEFTLTDADGNVIQKKTTGSSGMIAFKNLEPGSYSILETKAPAHYKLYSTAQNVTLSKGQQVGYTLRDTREGDSSSGVLGWTSDNTLPKTGEVPVTPIVAVCGLLLIFTGIVLRRADLRKKRGRPYTE